MKKLLMLILCVCCARVLKAQQKDFGNYSAGTVDLTLTYQAAYNGSTHSFWLQGGSCQLEGHIWRGLGEVADITGLHTSDMHGSGVGLDLVTATFGPRYTVQVHDLVHRMDSKRRIALYGEALGGVANGFNSIFPAINAAEESETGTAMLLGSGINYAWTKHVSIRAIDAAWLRTTLPNGTNNVQNNLRLGAGIVWKLPHR